MYTLKNRFAHVRLCPFHKSRGQCCSGKVPAYHTFLQGCIFSVYLHEVRLLFQTLLINQDIETDKVNRKGIPTKEMGAMGHVFTDAFSGACGCVCGQSDEALFKHPVKHLCYRYPQHVSSTKDMARCIMHLENVIVIWRKCIVCEIRRGVLY